jgi:membrane-associated phospholipid phosphatase
VILQWNETLLNAIRLANTAPPPASRQLAMLHIAMYDAVDALAPRYSFYAVPGLSASPPPAAHAFPEVAAAAAADTVLDRLYPTQTATFDAQFRSYLTGYPGHGQAVSASTGWGQSVANAVLAWRSTDGAGVTVPYTPGSGPGVWQPTPPAFAAALFPQWPTVTPFTMTSGSQFRPDPPPALTSAAYATALNEVKALGGDGTTTPSSRTPAQTAIATFWADNAGTETPPGHWNTIAADVARARGTTAVENARLFALLNLALADAAIVAWDCKYVNNFWRPVTAIRAADTDGNPATTPDTTWTPLLVTPAFPSYTSGHSTFSAAAAAVLGNFFGTDQVPFTTGSDALPGVTRSFAGFAAAAAEAGQSRIYGGIHFQFDNQEGLASGRALGQFVSRNFLLRAGGDDGDEPQGDSARSAQALALWIAGQSSVSAAGGGVLSTLTSGNPAPLPPSQGSDAPATPSGKDPSGQQVSAPDPPAAGAAQRRVLDQLFADLDGGL